MHCVNHPGTEAQSYCQHCGKPLCPSCVRTTASGQIFCEQCLAATAGDPSQTYWQGGQIPPFYPAATHGPNPSVAAVLGLIPGVGAMYNGQLFKGLIHVFIFAVLVSLADHYHIFGLFIAAWVLYQIFEAYHTAKARRDGLPVPDPFGLNELGSWFNLGFTARVNPRPPNGNQAPPPAGGNIPPEPPPYSAPYTSSWTGYAPGPGGGPIPQQPPYTEPYAGPNPEAYAENYPPGTTPPIPPVPPTYYWQRKEPIFAFVLIGLGIIFLLQSLGFVTHLIHYIWPFMLIGLGVWLILRRVGYTQGGPK